MNETLDIYGEKWGQEHLYACSIQDRKKWAAVQEVQGISSRALHIAGKAPQMHLSGSFINGEDVKEQKKMADCDGIHIGGKVGVKIINTFVGVYGVVIDFCCKRILWDENRVIQQERARWSIYGKSRLEVGSKCNETFEFYMRTELAPI